MSGFGTSSRDRDDFDSDMSDEDEEAGVLTGWLDEEDPEDERAPKPVVPDPPKIDIVHKSKYIVDNLNLFYALCEVDDWGFVSMTDEQQEDIMQALTVRSYEPGENIIVEGDLSGELYIVTAAEETADFAEVEVVNGNILAGTEVFLTRLHRGQYFGQKFFLTRRANKRGATVRVPKDSQCPVNVAMLAPDHFDKWDSFRNLLLVKTVPLVQMLPRKERQKILQNLTIKEFTNGEYIVTQGEIGEEFFIIQEGSVKVVEKRPSPEKGWEAPQEVTLVTLREGHFFGEMSLVTDAPRVASVISIKNTICLCLSKSVFRTALSDETFNEVLTEVLSKRKNIRKQRESTASVTAGNGDVSDQTGSSGSSSSVVPAPMIAASPNMRKGSQRRRASTSAGSVNSEVSVSTTLSMRKLESGSRVVNKYVVERELGKGSYGEVYLCHDLETNLQFAMKMINRPNSTWNDDASSSIRQEIAVMKRLAHQNIVNLHEVIDDQNARKIFLIQEFMQGGALMDDAEFCDPIDPSKARKYFRDILKGVCYLHSEGIVHRDIKPQNMLLSQDGTVKIADFGAAVFTAAQEKVAYGGTPAFMAPELFLTNTDIDFSKHFGIDVFALGATLYFLVVGKPPWMARNQIDLATKIKNIELTFPNYRKERESSNDENEADKDKDNSAPLDPHLKHLLRQMLAKDYRTRPKLDDIVIDDWVTFEGSEPLFEEEDYCGTSYSEFLSFAEHSELNEPDGLKILIMDRSMVNRTMLSQKISLAGSAVCACVADEEEMFELLKSAAAVSPDDNFDYVLCQVDPDAKGLEILHRIRSEGFTGNVIATTFSADDLKEFTAQCAADMVVRCPIATRDVTKMLNKEDFAMVVAQRKASFSNKAGSMEACTQEEVEHAITLHNNANRELIREFNRSNSMMSERECSVSEGRMSELTDFTHMDSSEKTLNTQSELGRRRSSKDMDDSAADDDEIKDFQLSHSMKSASSRSLHEEIYRSKSAEASRLNVFDNERSLLSRKRGFMVVPYDNSARASNRFGSNGMSMSGSNKGDNDGSGQSLRIVTMSQKDAVTRKKRRDAALDRSKLAHLYRCAKQTGDLQAINSSKSLLNLLKTQSVRTLSNNVATGSRALLHGRSMRMSKDTMEAFPAKSMLSTQSEDDDSARMTPPHSNNVSHYTSMHSMRSITESSEASDGISDSDSDLGGSIIDSSEEERRDKDGYVKPDSKGKHRSNGSKHHGNHHHHHHHHHQKQQKQHHHHNSNSSNIKKQSLGGDHGNGGAENGAEKPKLQHNHSPRNLPNMVPKTVKTKPDKNAEESVRLLDVDNLDADDFMDLDDSDEDDDDDLGEGEMIAELDDAAMDSLFAELAKPKDKDEAMDLQQWNHIMVGKELNKETLIAPLGNTNLKLEIKVAGCDNIVGRTYMEDRTYINVSEATTLSNNNDSLSSESSSDEAAALAAAIAAAHGSSGCPLALLGVFDGHNGSYVAESLKQHFGSTFNRLLRAAESHPDFHDMAYESRIGQIFEETCLFIDGEILKEDYNRQLNVTKNQEVQAYAGSAAVMMAVMPIVHRGGGSMRSPVRQHSSAVHRHSLMSTDRSSLNSTPTAAEHMDSSANTSKSGSPLTTAAVAGITETTTTASAATATVGTLGTTGTELKASPAGKMMRSASLSSAIHSVTEPPTRIQVFVAHVGDCRAVLCSDGVAVALTEDHKANVKAEKARIESAGGWVSNGRVNGALGVARSFGDIQFKKFDEAPGFVNGVEDMCGSLWGPQQQVISKPDFKHFVVERPFEFVILASDGLWDVFTNQEAVNFVRKQLSISRNVEKAAHELIQKAISRGTQDNTSVAICCFHQKELNLM